MSLKFLESFGLNTKETEIYELLLQLGESPAQIIVKESGLKRATAYKILYQLIDKKLVSKRTLNKKIHFKPSPPQNLFHLADQQQLKINQARDNLEAIISDLNSNFLLSVERPIVTTFEGINGLKKIYLDTLKGNQPLFAILQTNEIDPELFKWLTSDYVKKRTTLKIPVKSIISTGSWAEQYHQKDQTELRESRMVPAFKFPIQHETIVYGNKFALIQNKKDEQLVGIVIQHPLVAQSMRAWFNLAWEATDNYLPLKNN